MAVGLPPWQPTAKFVEASRIGTADHCVTEQDGLVVGFALVSSDADARTLMGGRARQTVLERYSTLSSLSSIAGHREPRPYAATHATGGCQYDRQ